MISSPDPLLSEKCAPADLPHKPGTMRERERPKADGSLPAEAGMPNLIRALLLAFVSLLLVAGCGDDSHAAAPVAMTVPAAEAPEPEDTNYGVATLPTWDTVEELESASIDRDVPYVPTRYDTVDKMLEMAKISGDDVVFDLGSGDGRIVIEAARKYGARGVGYDIDPQRITEANQNAKSAGVTDHVKFIEGDLFKADLSEATAVTLYLLPDVNLRLRPKLLAELKPGTPVVSHDFHMGDWAPDDRARVGTDTIYLWIVPANVDGRGWEWTGPDGAERTANFQQKFQTLGGTVDARDQRLRIDGGRLDGRRIAFGVTDRAGSVVERYDGVVAGNTIRGTVETLDGRRSAWQATRR
jgi:hypothetical protein